MAVTPPAGFIDAAWWEVYSAPLRAEQLTQQAWIDALAMAYRIIRIPESLDARQLERQQDMVDRALGRKFYTTTPFISANDGTQIEWPAIRRPDAGAAKLFK